MSIERFKECCKRGWHAVWPRLERARGSLALIGPGFEWAKASAVSLLRKVSSRLLLGSFAASALTFLAGYAVLKDSSSTQQAGFLQRFGRSLARASYDWSFDLARYSCPTISGSDVVIVYVDDCSLKELNHSVWLPMKRSVYAEFLDRLTRDGAKGVVMDTVFNDSLDENTDLLLEEAMRRNGRVVLGIDYAGPETISLDDLAESEEGNHGANSPYQLFAESAARLGFVSLQPESDFMVRRHRHLLPSSQDAEVNAPSSLSWAAAEQLHVKAAQNRSERKAERWVYYYGPPDTIPHLSFKSALETERPGFFRNKVVFVGLRSSHAQGMEKSDELRSPYSEAGTHEYLFMPAAEVHATEFLNLARGDWLRRPSRAAHLGILACAAVVLGFGLIRFRPLIATSLCFVALLVVILAVQNLFARQHIWFDWLLIVGVQIPTALLSVVLFRSVESLLQARRLQEERREAYIQIRDQAALLDQAQDAIIVHDLTWAVKYWNKSSERLYGWAASEASGRSLGTLIFKPEDRKSVEAFQQTLATSEWHGELEQVTRSGSALVVYSRWTLVSDEQGEAKAIFVINTDITEQKQLEAQFLRTQRLESIGTLAGGIAHDLNNVLAPILMGVELLKNHVTDERARKMLATMAGSATRGSELVKQVLAFARGHQGERTLVQIPGSIRELQKIALDTFAKSIQVRLDVRTVPPVLGDPTQIHQILLNLVVNARDAMPKGGEMAICVSEVRRKRPSSPLQILKPGANHTAFINRAATPETNYVLVSVADTGMGIPSAILEKIFDPFFTTKEPSKGTGLGLSTVLSIIKSHSGFLELRTEMGKGTVFNVYLPVAQAAAPVSANDSSLLETYRGHGETVMLVDDDPAVLEASKETLSHFGYNVLTAEHGAAALALQARHAAEIKAVVMDVMMPVMDGPTAMKELRARHPELPVLLVSGFSTPERIRERLGDMEVLFLAKPYTADKLLKEVATLTA